MSWWLATVLFGSVLLPLADRVNWADREQLGGIEAVTLVVPVLGVVYFDLVMLLTLRSPFAGPADLGVTALGLIVVLAVIGLVLPRVGRRGAVIVLIPAVGGLVPCVVLISRGAPAVSSVLTVLGVGGLVSVTGLSSLRVIGASSVERLAHVTPRLDRRTRLALLLVALLVPAALVLHVPSTLASTFCAAPDAYDVTDVRISYDRAAMIGPSGVYVRGRQVYFLDQQSLDESPLYRVGTVRTATIRRLLSVIRRNGIRCLNDQYRGLVLLTEPTSEYLRVSTGTASKTIAVEPAAAAPPQVERTIDALWETGRAQPRVNASRFCARLPADADTRLGDHCRSLEATDAIGIPARLDR